MEVFLVALNLSFSGTPTEGKKEMHDILTWAVNKRKDPIFPNIDDD